MLLVNMLLNFAVAEENRLALSFQLLSRETDKYHLYASVNNYIVYNGLYDDWKGKKDILSPLFSLDCLEEIAEKILKEYQTIKF